MRPGYEQAPVPTRSCSAQETDSRRLARRPQIAHHSFDPQTTLRLPGPCCLDAHSAVADVFRRSSLPEHLLLAIGEPHFQPLATPLFSSATIHGLDCLAATGVKSAGGVGGNRINSPP